MISSALMFGICQFASEMKGLPLILRMDLTCQTTCICINTYVHYSPFPREPAGAEQSIDLQFHSLACNGPKIIFTDDGSLQQWRFDLPKCDTAAVL